MYLIKKVVPVGLVAVVVLAMAPVAVIYAEDTVGVDVVLSGEPVDMNCYLTGKSGEEHASCAIACATKGNPIGLVVEQDGKRVLYLVLGAGGKASKDLLAEHMGTIVDVTGKASKKGGLNILVASEVSAEEEEWFPEDVVGAGSIVNTEE